MPSTAEAPQRTNTDLLNLIRSRGEKQTKFGQGILTADRWVKNLRDEVGLDICYQMAAKGTVSFDDVLRKSAETLTYNNPDMVVQGKMHDFGSIQTELPKNTLMVFQHVLTTPRKDRDGDILRTEGANVDPRMLLLWQHVHTLPIGKMLGVVEHTKDRLSLLSALVDINSLAHDAAVMVDNDMARFSHGFQARDWAPLEEKEGEFPGFEVREFDIMEESIVSIPSNADADMQEVFLSLVENGKLTSPLCKEQGRQIRKSRPVAVALGVSLKEKIDENKSADRSDETGEGEGVGDSTPKETKEVVGEKAETGSAEVAEVVDDQPETTAPEEVSEDVVAESQEVELGDETPMNEAQAQPDDTKQDEELVDEPIKEPVTAQKTMAIFLEIASPEDRQKMLSILQALKQADDLEAKQKQFREFVRSDA